MKKKILIIGANGYLGSILYLYLESKGYSCYNHDIDYFKNNLLYSCKKFRKLKNNKKNVVIEDIKDFNSVIFLAGFSNDPFGDLKPSQFYKPTVKYTLRVAKMCKKLGITFIFPSSCSVYGMSNINISLTENSKTAPVTYYSKNKIEIEDKLKKISSKDFNPIMLRLATIFGLSPRMRFDIVINMLSGMALVNNKITLNSNGLAWRPHLHIYDACQAFYHSLNWKPLKKEKFLMLNVGDNKNNTTIIDIAKIIQKKLKKCKIEFQNKTDSIFVNKNVTDGVDKRSYKVNFDKLNKTFPKFKTKWFVKEGIEDLLNNLKTLKLDKKKLTNKKFHRLKYYEFLDKKNKLFF
ncbi:SDR family oxidoreductase [Candidatus Pelagibacter sp.]|nr:SDR family oxidoreductase [Candidatus Pelagibacter sp.]